MKIIHFLQLINIYKRDKKITSLFMKMRKKSTCYKVFKNIFIFKQIVCIKL